MKFSRDRLTLEPLPEVARGRLLVFGLIALFLWQFSLFFTSPGMGLEAHRLDASSGVHRQDKFLYFYYYLGYFPVASMRPNRTLDYSPEGARREVEQFGEYLVTEYGHTTRYGELGKTFLLMPGAWLAGTPAVASFTPTNVLCFWIALAVTWVGFLRQGFPVLGGALVLLFGSNPFQLYEVYLHNNVFGFPISIGLILLTLHLPMLLDRPVGPVRFWLTPVFCGVLLASIRQVRSEPVALLAGCGLAYLFLSRTPWWKKRSLLVLLLISLQVTSVGWKALFGHKIEQARAFVTQAGSEPFPGPREQHHTIAHPVWCGLGDFDTRYGYAFDDRVAWRYALPILRSEYGVDAPPYEGQAYFYPNEFWDERQFYYKTPEELPHYYEVLQRKMVHDMTTDPLWYLEILAKRALRILSRTSEVWVAGPGFHYGYRGRAG